MEPFNPQGVLLGFYVWLVPMVLVGLGALGLGLVKRCAAGVITGLLFAALGAFSIWLINQ